MPRVVFVEPTGERRELEAPVGQSLMETARQNAVDGIVAQCGGACACATCHVYVEPSWLDRLPAPQEMERVMLENAWHPRENSRLSCQIGITPELDGLTVTVPEQQG